MQSVSWVSRSVSGAIGSLIAMAATVHIDLATIVFAIAGIMSLCVLATTLGRRILGEPPAGHSVGRFEITVATLYVGFLMLGPVWLAFTLTEGACK